MSFNDSHRWTLSITQSLRLLLPHNHAAPLTSDESPCFAGRSGIVKEGETIAAYPDDKPFASTVVLGFDGGRPVHVVVARDADTGRCHVVTVYRPDPAAWGDDFKTRRMP